MKLLLDTHVFLWLVDANQRLSRPAKAAILDPENERFLSVASIWELAIKAANKRISLMRPVGQFVEMWTGTYRIEILPVTAAHAAATGDLPPNHRDPFDRMLIAQAVVEGMTLLSIDPVFKDYPAPVLG